jgi:hypothetical protein
LVVLSFIGGNKKQHIAKKQDKGQQAKQGVDVTLLDGLQGR